MGFSHAYGTATDDSEATKLANGFLTGRVKKGMQAGFDGAAGDYRANMPQFEDENTEKSQSLLDMLDRASLMGGAYFLVDGGCTAAYWYGDLQYLQEDWSKS